MAPRVPGSFARMTSGGSAGQGVARWHVTDMWVSAASLRPGNVDVCDVVTSRTLDAEVAGVGVTDLRGQWRILAWKLAILPGRFGPWFGLRNAGNFGGGQGLGSGKTALTECQLFVCNTLGKSLSREVV